MPGPRGCLVLGGAWLGVCLVLGGCLVWGVPGPRGCLVLGNTWSWGCGIPACTEEDPPCGQTDTCKNITFATSLRTVIISGGPFEVVLCPVILVISVYNLGHIGNRCKILKNHLLKLAPITLCGHAFYEKFKRFKQNPIKLQDA